jgi:prepilin-type N-terminal cleavage/methylation domain-containing protein
MYLRRGLTLIELVVVMAVIALIAVMGVPALNTILGIEQHSAIKEIGQTLTWLQEEAAMRNVAFRMEINLDRNKWKVEVGEPNTLIFATPDEAEQHRENIKDKMKRYSKRQLESGMVDLGEDPSNFSTLDNSIFTTSKSLPPGLQFAFVYTPQYGNDGIEPHNEPPDDPEEDHIAHIHIFPDGTAEHTVIRVINIEDEEDGYSLEMEPLGGGISMTEDIIDPEDSLRWLPDEGPTIQ